jgi:hypothetical protein
MQARLNSMSADVGKSIADKMADWKAPMIDADWPTAIPIDLDLMAHWKGPFA